MPTRWDPAPPGWRSSLDAGDRLTDCGPAFRLIRWGTRRCCRGDTMLRGWAVLTITMLLAGCDRGARNGITDPSSDRTAAAVSGVWRVTASYEGSSHLDAFSWDAMTSPFLVTIAEDRLRLDMPCRTCDAGLRVSPGALTLAPLRCEPRGCVAHPNVEAWSEGVERNLFGDVRVQVRERPPEPHGLVLRSSRGALDLER